MRTPKGLPTASRLQLAMTCAASHALGVVDSAWASGTAGNEKHAALARIVEPEVVDAEPLSQETLDWVGALEESVLVPLMGATTEVAYAYDVTASAARLIGHHVGRHYDAKPTEFAGSADYVSLTDGVVMVADLKTGMTDVPHPARNAQLRFLALAAARVHGVESARLGILHAPEGRTPWWSWATLDAFGLEEVALELRALSERIGYARRDVAAGATPRLTVGEHCNHCPARHGCPVRVAMAQRLAGEPEKVVLDLKAMLTPDSAALALARWKAAKKALEEVGAALYAYAAESPIPLGDGRVWGPVTSEREVIDAEAAWLVLSETFGGDVARKAMTLETSKAGVERAMKALRESLRGAATRPAGVPEGKVTIKALNETALAALRAAGAVTTKTTTTYEEHAAALTSGAAIEEAA